MATYLTERRYFVRSPASCLFCLGLCMLCPGNANSEPHPLPELVREPLLELRPCVLSTNESNQAEPHPSEFSSGRFSTATDEELAKLAEGLVPEITAKTTNWAMKNFQQWVSSRSQFDSTRWLFDVYWYTDYHQTIIEVHCWNQKVKWWALPTCYTSPEVDKLFSLVDMYTIASLLLFYWSCKQILKCLKEGIMNHNIPCS